MYRDERTGIAAGRTWALVLAAGQGSRLQTLTTAGGITVPKQFCSLAGGLSLLHEALQRAESVAPRERICTIVASQHRRWWEGALASVPAPNVIVQPENRGTANGILLSLLHIMERDPQANVVILPADHHVLDEERLAGSLQQAVRQLESYRREILLLGLEPEEIDPELGYIVPGVNGNESTRTVERFVEKPSESLTRQLIAAGALWNSFILAARMGALLDLFNLRFPEVVDEMRAVVVHDSGDPTRPTAATHLYRSLREIDFSRHIAQGCEALLRVVAVPPCGWSDLGTPRRVAQALQRVNTPSVPQAEHFFPLGGHLNLAAQHSLLQASG